MKRPPQSKNRKPSQAQISKAINNALNKMRNQMVEAFGHGVASAITANNEAVIAPLDARLAALEARLLAAEEKLGKRWFS